MKGLLAKATVALTAFFSVRKVQELSEAFTNLQNRLKQVAEGEQLDQLQEKIFEGANSARVSVEEYASAFLRFDLVNKQLGGSQEETLKIMDSLAKGLSASGAAASEVNSVMLQLAQAF
jgi:phage-related minor tail protein